MNKSVNKLFKEFSKSIPNIKNKSNQLFTIRFIGLNATGKSTVAKILSEKLNLYIASNDIIRRFLNSQGIFGDYPNQDLVRKMAGRLSPYLYNHKISHIYDADHISFYKYAKGIATKHGSKFYLVHITCPESVVIKRLKKRKFTSADLSRADYNEYLKRKELHRKLGVPKGIFMTIDTSQDLSPQIDLLIRKLKQEQVI